MPQQQDKPQTDFPDQSLDQTTGIEKFVYVIRQLITVVILPIAIIGGGVYCAMYLKDSGPKAERRERKHNAPMVDVAKLTPTDHTIVVHAMGTVIPSRKISLYPQVIGQIIEMDQRLEPGGHFQTGQIMLKIDPDDYQLAVDQKQAEVDQVQANYRIEEGQQAIAKQEFELLGQDVSETDRDLILRKPQLQTMAAKLKIAQAQLKQSKLDLKRTTIHAPFNAMVLERNVNVGSHITTGSALSQLVGIDTYWVQVSVPVDQLKWITIPSSQNEIGSSVRIYNEAAWGQKAFRTGHVVRLSGTLEEAGRMAQLIVAVNDPLALDSDISNKPSLIIDSYVRVEIQGTKLQNVFRVARTALQHDDTLHLYVDGQLDIRHVDIVHRAPKHVIIREGLSANEMLITSDISAPVAQMPLRTESSNQLAKTGQANDPQTAKPTKASEQ